MNFFTRIAQLIAFSKLNGALKDAEEMLSEDPQIVSAAQSMAYHANQLQKLLPDFCKRHPESELCKERTKGK